ncbi:MAG TPA: cyclase family protein [Verrucomicrobiae bacterium]|nr:cyclase family protein [Verrucomicrobiae bacterium]
MPEPSEAEAMAMMDQLSNWGRWGPDDRNGTLNFVTSDVQRRALAVPQAGRCISLARGISPTDWEDMAPRTLRFMVVSGERADQAGQSVAAEWFGLPTHGYSTTHLDSLGHVFWKSKMYNGLDASEVDQLEGARRGSIEDAGDGIMTRAVLLDLPSTLGVDYLPNGYRIRPDELEAAERQAGITLGSGDALLFRTGRDVDRQARGPFRPWETGSAGLSAACMPWIHEREVSLLGSDGTQDPYPHLYPNFESVVHVVGIVAMGLWILDNCYLENLVAASVERGSYEFQLVISPLKLEGATGSPVNPMAIL